MRIGIALTLSLTLAGCYHSLEVTTDAGATEPDAFVAQDAFAAPDAAPACWDLDGDFSTTEAEHGAWAYGWIASDLTFRVGTSITLGGGLDGWAGIYADGSGAILPYVVRNDTGAPLAFENDVVPSGAIALHPGPLCERAVVRWTAPLDATYAIDLDVISISSGGANFAITIGSDTLTAGTVATGRGVHVMRALHAGDVVAYSIGCPPMATGADGGSGHLHVCSLR